MLQPSDAAKFGICDSNMVHDLYFGFLCMGHAAISHSEVEAFGIPCRGAGALCRFDKRLVRAILNHQL